MLHYCRSLEGKGIDGVGGNKKKGSTEEEEEKRGGQ